MSKHNHQKRKVHRYKVSLQRKHKNTIHTFLIVSITCLLFIEGATMADWSFLVLAIAVEVA